MANRASRLSAPWVQSLNAIETEFYGNTKVIEAWRVIVDHLYSAEANDSAQVDRWNEKLGDLVNELLFEMGKSLGYHFDKVTLKRNAYYPRGWGEIELEQHAIRKKFLEVLDGKRDRKSTRLNSSHITISYAVFCLKKKKNRMIP